MSEQDKEPVKSRERYRWWLDLAKRRVELDNEYFRLRSGNAPLLVDIRDPLLDD